MSHKAGAGGLLALLILVSLLLIGLHWHGDVNTFVQSAIQPAQSTAPVQWAHGSVDVNTADYDELLMLDGINKAQIQALLDNRELYGPFDYPEDLISVKGIAEKTLDKLYDQLDFSWRIDGN